MNNSLACSPRFDSTRNLRLLPKFDEKDQIHFFFFFYVYVANDQNSPDREHTLLLQCIFTGKAQKAYAVLTAEQCRHMNWFLKHTGSVSEIEGGELKNKIL